MKLDVVAVGVLRALRPLFIVCVWLGVQQVHAHANLVRAQPEPESVNATSPARVQVWFNEPLQRGGSTLSVRDAQGRQVDNGDATIDPADAQSMFVSVRPLPHGIYTVLWENTSSVDGHSLAGAFPFTVGEARPSANYTALVQDVERVALALQPPTLVEWISRWAWLFSLTSVTGAFAFVPLIMRSATLSSARGRIAPRRRRLLIGLMALALAALAFEAVVRAAKGDAVAFASSRYAGVALARVGLLGALFALWLARRESSAWVLLPAALLWLTQSAGSHSAAGNELAPVVADWLHLAFTAVWLGGVTHLALVNVPVALRSQPATGLSSQKNSLPAGLAELGLAIDRFSPWAMFCVLGLAMTGLAQSAAFVGSIEALWTTAYGRALGVKLILFGVLIAFGALHQFVFAPKLRAYRSLATEAHRAARQFRLSVLAELSVLVLTLLAAGAMIALPPSRDVAPQSSTAFLHSQRSDSGMLTLGVSPASAGANQFVLRLDSPADNVVLRLESASFNTGQTEIALSRYTDNVFVAQSSALALPSAWKIEAIARRAGKPDARAVFDVRVK